MKRAQVVKALDKLKHIEGSVAHKSFVRMQFTLIELAIYQQLDQVLKPDNEINDSTLGERLRIIPPGLKNKVLNESKLMSLSDGTINNVGDLLWSGNECATSFKMSVNQILRFSYMQWSIIFPELRLFWILAYRLKELFPNVRPVASPFGYHNRDVFSDEDYIRLVNAFDEFEVCLPKPGPISERIKAKAYNVEPKSFLLTQVNDLFKCAWNLHALVVTNN